MSGDFRALALSFYATELARVSADPMRFNAAELAKSFGRSLVESLGDFRSY